MTSLITLRFTPYMSVWVCFTTNSYRLLRSTPTKFTFIHAVHASKRFWLILPSLLTINYLIIRTGMFIVMIDSVKIVLLKFLLSLFKDICSLNITLYWLCHLFVYSNVNIMYIFSMTFVYTPLYVFTIVYIALMRPPSGISCGESS